MKTLITTDELPSTGVTIFDCRAALMDHNQGRKDYQAGHIPGALFADLEIHLSANPGIHGRHPLPEKAELVNFLRESGVNNDSSIVCYDQNSGAFAARLWWLMRWLGHEDVGVLDGGLDAWLTAGGELETESKPSKPGHFEAGEPLNQTCSADELINSGRKLIDARDRRRYRGEAEPIDKIAGHIPGAVCLPFTENLNNGRFLSPAELRERFVDCDEQTVCYCGSGVTAAHNILAICRAGLPEPALYPGSWSEWIEDPGRPVATGDE